MKTHPLLAGALAGFAATVPMTGVMMSLRRALPRHQRYPLPPRIITVRAAHKTGATRAIDDEPEQSLATSIAYFGYGTTMGALYAPLARLAPSAPAPVKGITYGLLVWAFGYLGWLPMAGLHPRGTQEPLERESMNVFSHVVWGACLGWLTDRISRTHGSHNAKTVRGRKRKGAGHDATRTESATALLTR